MSVKLSSDNNRRSFEADVQFLPNGCTYRLQTEALEKFVKFGLYERIVSPIRSTPFEPTSSNTRDHEEQYTSSTLNAEQIVAVRAIISMSGNLPFILFGPPGTGKSKTIVAATQALVSRDNRILLCAQSNTVCDELALRLLETLDHPKDMMRVYAMNFKRPISQLKKHSNYDDINDTMRPLTVTDLTNIRVFICTVAASGLFFAKSKKQSRKQERHTPKFDYLLIDEAASTSESMTLIPITGKQ